MKKFLLLIFSFFIFTSEIYCDYQSQWFDSYSQSEDNLKFKCSKQCFILVDQKLTNNYIEFNWNITWKWMIGYWFLNWQQIVPWEFVNFENNTVFNSQKLLFTKLPFYSQLPPDIQIMLIIDWNISTDWFSFSLWKTGLFENIWNSVSSFWSFDTFKPYTINLLYWPMTGWANANNFFYFIFFISLFWLFFIEKKKKYLLIISLTLIIFYDIRMTLEFYWYFKNDYSTYISKTDNEKNYRDRGDFYSFLDFVTNKLKEQWLNQDNRISFFTDNTRPFPWLSEYLLYPYKVDLNKMSSNRVFVFYWYSKVKVEDDNIYLDWVKLWSWKIVDFSNNWFIFIKK